MSHREQSRRTRGNSKVKKTKPRSRAAAIDNALAEMDRLKAMSPRVAPIIELFQGWLTDESGYDEETWPKLRKALERERARAGARRLFDG